MDKIKGIFVVPLATLIVLVPFSLLFSKVLVAVLLFWFVIVPLIAVNVPVIISSRRNHLIKSLTGLVLLYGLMVFMIYDHYQTDLFKILMVSAAFNIVLTTIVILIKKYSPEYS